MELKQSASMSSRAPAIICTLLLAFLAASVMAEGVLCVMATFVDYNAPPNWDLGASSAMCAAVDWHKPQKWREHYWWAAYCGQFLCGWCMQVTNVATGAALTVRVVDNCDKIIGRAVLGIDTAGFLAIDNDGRGRRDGQLVVDCQFVDCQD